jgi:four helix bundle protein
MNRDELKERTKRFALRVMRLVDAVPKSTKGRALASQLIRSGTGVAANYRAACRGRSRAEFIAKIGVAEEEADETALWMELIIVDALLSKKKVQSLLDEANELVAIMAASYISAQKNAVRNRALASQKPAIRNQQSKT